MIFNTVQLVNVTLQYSEPTVSVMRKQYSKYLY